MKKIIKNIGPLLLIFLLGSCGKDNYDAPESQLTGRVIYDGQPLGVRGSNRSVYLQLWQDGYELKTPINVYVTQDGSFTAKLFNGTYKLVSTNGNGPWVSSQDTVVVQVNGNTTADYSVHPYYTINNITYALEGGILKASFDITTVDESRDIEYVTLMVNDTKFIDFGQKMSSVQQSVNNNHVDLELNISDNLNTAKALFARVGLKIAGVTEGVYDTEITQLK